MTIKKSIAILGSTGSIGKQALEVIQKNPDQFEVEVLTAQSNWEELVKQALQFQPNAVVIADERYYNKVKEILLPKDIKVFAGEKAIASVVQMDTIDMVLTALVGFSGLFPTLKALEAKKMVALANKETLVVAGDLVTRKAKENQVVIYPVDSEHSAIFQCLVGEFHNPVEKIILTASGGPFRGMKREQLEKVTKDDALKHPNWNMGRKVTIDSASLMNKGLEIIEAHWFFGLPPSRMEVLVHPQSIIHSMVQFADGNIKAQLSLPDMRIPIQYALSYPVRCKADFPRVDFTKLPNFTFEPPDMETFRNLALAFEALNKEGNMPCVLNAANEIAVEAFLNDKIKFLQIPDVVEKCMQELFFVKKPTLEDYITTDQETRIKATQIINRWKEW